MAALLRDLSPRRRAHALTSKTVSYDIHEDIHSWVSFSFLYEGSSAIKKWNLSAGVVWAEQKCQVSYSNLLRSSRVIVVFSANKQNHIHKICLLVARLFAAGLRFSGSMWVNSRESETTRALWTRMGWSWKDYFPLVCGPSLSHPNTLSS